MAVVNPFFIVLYTVRRNSCAAQYYIMFGTADRGDVVACVLGVRRPKRGGDAA